MIFTSCTKNPFYKLVNFARFVTNKLVTTKLLASNYEKYLPGLFSNHVGREEKAIGLWLTPSMSEKISTLNLSVRMRYVKPCPGSKKQMSGP